MKAEARRLHTAWEQAYSRMKRTDASIDDQAESDAWDTLIEFVEAHDLVYTELDPRGPYGSLYGENEGEGR